MLHRWLVLSLCLLFACGDNRNLADRCSDACPDRTPTCDGTSVVTYATSCTDTGTVSCEYSETRMDCAATAQVCASGACVAPNDPCATTTCATPPAATCSGTVAHVYDSNGTCDSSTGSGVCAYAPHDIDCASTGQLCDNGACVDPCNGVTCDTPPADMCTGTMSTTYAATGTCDASTGTAVCHYTPTTTNCATTNGACDMASGDCIAPCTGVTCSTPPAASCSGTSSTTYGATGTCDGTSGSAVCSYTPTTVDCAATGQTCDGATGLCTDVCTGVTCTTPPPPHCDAVTPTTSISFSATGTCDGSSGSPVCSYTPTPTDCTASNQTCDPGTGLCADPCTLTSCTTPPAATCTSNTLTTFDPAGTCAATSGIPTCTYAPTITPCGAGFCDLATASCLADCGGSTCTTPPAAFCTGDVATSYGATGTCDTSSAPTCVYAPTTTDCTLIGQRCDTGACVNRDASVRTQSPATITDIAGTSQTVYGRIYIQGVTDVTSGNDALEFLDLVEFGIGTGADPTLYTYSLAAPNPSYAGDEATYDEYMATFQVAGAPGAIEQYAYRLSLDGGNTWIYGDLGTAGSSDGFTTPGTLNVASPFFSEYVEGAGNDKALEIYNPGSVAFSLNGCVIRQWTNMNTPPTNVLTFAAGDIVDSTGVVTFCQTATLSLPGAPTSCTKTTTSMALWNGNDTLELYCGGAVLDSIGKEQELLTGFWGTEPTTTINHTLLRNCDVIAGDTNATDAFDPVTQWKSYPSDTLTDLGKRTCPLP